MMERLIYYVSQAGSKVGVENLVFLRNSTSPTLSAQGFREYFENPQFRSDGLKLYPTLVIRGTGLYELWKTGR